MTLQSINRFARNIAKATLRLPRGFDLYHDLRLIIPDPKVVFDVGANIGQSAKRYLKEFPRATIYSFEPVASTFQKLITNVRFDQRSPELSRFRPVMCALGAETCSAHMKTAEGSSDMFQIDPSGNEEVKVSTVDHWGGVVGHVDFMKIDTEGHDFEVLKGAEKMLREKRITAIQVEAGMYPGNNRHVPLEAFKSHFEERGYLLFGFYDQVEEFFTNEQHLRRTNPVFVVRR